MSFVTDLPDLASGPSLATAGALLVAGGVASVLRRQALAEVCVTWGLGFLALHLLGGLAGGSVSALLAMACGLLAVLIVAIPALSSGAEPAADADETRVVHRREEVAAAHDEAAERLARPLATREPSTHLWSVDGYREVTRRSAR